MSMTADKIVAEALELSPHARAFVAEKLIESLDVFTGAEISPAWREEIRKRCREVDEEFVQLRDAADVFAKAYAELG
ncbi:MAG: addiction module protein [Planctomycetota bacterium]